VSSATVNPSLKNRCFRILRKVSPAQGVLPKSYFPPGVTLSDIIPYASGGFADIWKGQQDGKPVCVKAFRTQTAANLDKIKRVCGRSLFQRRGELDLIPIRGSIVRSWGGSMFRTRTSYRSLAFPSHCSRSASSALGCRTETSSSLFGKIGGSIDCSW
jgi:hypothetical protein